jgi:hypothetical protein
MSEQINTSTVTIADLFTAERYSPYKMTAVVNQALAACGINKAIPPQMLYQYTADKSRNTARYIATEVVDGKRFVVKAAAIEWTEAYVLKQLARQS